MPHALAGSRVEAHEAAGEKIVAGAMAAVEITRRRFDGQIHVAQFFIRGQRRPYGRVASVGPRIVQPRVVAELAGLRDRVERPQAFSRADVISADVALRVFLRARRRASDHCCTEHDDVAYHDGGRGRADDAIAGWWLIEVLI